MNGSDDRKACAVSAPLQAVASIHSKIGWKGARTDRFALDPRALCVYRNTRHASAAAIE